jgi:TPR repeat protein
MKTLITITLILITTLSLNAKTTNLYNHARDARLSSLDSKNVKNGSKKLFFAKRAAKKGNPKAQFDLAIIYAKGEIVKRDERAAFKWFHKSAKGGNIEAKYYMGLSFLQGRGVKKDIHLARHWFKQAVKAGHKRATIYLGKVEATLAKTNGTKYSSR